MTDTDTFGRFRILAVTFLVVLIGVLGAVILSPHLHEPHAPDPLAGRARVEVKAGEVRIHPEALDQPVREVAVEPTTEGVAAAVSLAAPDTSGATFVIRAVDVPLAGRARLHVLAQAGLESASAEASAAPAEVLGALGKALADAGFSVEYRPEDAREVRIRTLPNGRPLTALMLTLETEGPGGVWSVGLAGR